jgi:GxxExxY protein
MVHENQIGDSVIDCALRVHKNLGPGLLESAYQACLSFELEQAGLEVIREAALPVVYKDVHLQCGYRIDLWVNRKVILEIKSLDALNDVHLAQVFTYLRLTENRLGYLLNFHVAKLKYGIRRVVNGL